MIDTPPNEPRPDAGLAGPVLVVGAGLIGASVAMALMRAGVQTHLKDVDPTVAHVASSRGAGSDAPLRTSPEIVVVATPPEHLGAEIAAALLEFPRSVVTDVGSIKAKPLAELVALGISLDRYVGGHPMAGSERSGPLASSADLFDGRTWAVVTRDDCEPEAVSVTAALARTCGANVVRMDTQDHDLAVARVSHVPHLVAALTAAQLASAPLEHLALSGQGVRDVTRIAAGDPVLWQQIVTGNAGAISAISSQLRDELDKLVVSLRGEDSGGVRRLLSAGVAGTAVIPGKHGGPSLALEAVNVAIPDEPGALARLFADAGEADVNIEDIRIDHDPGRAFGLVEIDVAADSAERLMKALAARGWSVHR
ncbi:MAG: prephenate dehydrogenase [Nocardioidaceae bacterium]